jgi:hypothetical protein
MSDGILKVVEKVITIPVDSPERVFVVPSRYILFRSLLSSRSNERSTAGVSTLPVFWSIVDTCMNDPAVPEEGPETELIEISAADDEVITPGRVSCPGEV